MTALGLPPQFFAYPIKQSMADDAAADARLGAASQGPSGTDSMTVPTQDEELTRSLFRVATDGGMVTALHDVLGSFCHECRNTLNSLKLSLYLAKRDSGLCTSETLGELESRYHSVEQLFDRLQSICRPMRVTPIRASLALAIEDRRSAWIEAMAARQRELTLIPPRGPDVGDFDPVKLTESLDAFVHWRAEVGESRSPAVFRWGVQDGRFELEWSEPRAGRLVGVMQESARPDTLALPFLARVITAHGGTTTLALGDGLRLDASWPLVMRTPR